nr:helix-turn-helix domain-containing protein [Zhongshania antarctica]
MAVILANLNTQTAEDINDTAATSIAMLKQGKDPEAIAGERSLAITTIYGHLCQGIASGELNIGDVVTLSDAELKEIQFAFEHSEDGKIKPVYELLDGEYDYNILKCVKATLHAI